MLYVVLAEVDNESVDAWTQWMREQHIDDVMATRCFQHATFVRDEVADSDTRTAFRIYYLAESAAAFDRYQAEFGEGLRKDHTDRFGGVVQARRELLPVLARRP